MRLRRHQQSSLIARQVEPSMVASLDDEPAQPSDRLLDVALAAISAARNVPMPDMAARITDGSPDWTVVWPGEHYKLLAALVATTGARRVVDIGTFTGMSALAMMHALPADGQIVTFDIFPWHDFKGTVLRESDFESGQLSQVVGDLTDDQDFSSHGHILTDADLIFTDAAKDGFQERTFLRRFEEAPFANEPIVVFDDIRFINMLQIWRDIPRPKLDLTSFGHWSGTGLIDYALDTAV